MALPPMLKAPPAIYGWQDSMAGQQRGRVVRQDCPGPKWKARREDRWEEVWQRTGNQDWWRGGEDGWGGGVAAHW